jgi:hypothetical protein
MTNSTPRSRRIGIALLALTVLMGAMATGAVAFGEYSTSGPSIDTSTSDNTSTQSNLTDGDNASVAYGDTGDLGTYQYHAATNDSALEIREGTDDSGPLVYENTSPEQIDWQAASNYPSTGGEGHYNVTIAEEAVLDIEHTPGENVTTNVTLINDTTNDTEVTGYADLYIETDNNTVEAVGDDDVDDGDAETLDESGFVGDTDQTTLDYTDLSVSSDGDHVILVLRNDSVDDDMGLATDDVNPIIGFGGEAESETRIMSAPLVISDGDTTRVVFPYEEEAPSDVDDDDTYAVRKTVGGENAIEINKGDAFGDSDDEVDVTGTLNAGIGEYATRRAQSLTQGLMG